MAGTSRSFGGKGKERFNDSITQAGNIKEATRLKRRFHKRDCESDDSGAG